jgi:hypothetical protein
MRSADYVRVMKTLRLGLFAIVMSSITTTTAVLSAKLPIEGPMRSRAQAHAWLNSRPLSIRELHGKVVLVDFWLVDARRRIRHQQFGEGNYEQLERMIPQLLAESGKTGFRVSMDGQPPRASHGVDVDAEGYGTLDQPRMYQLIRRPAPVADRQIEIEFLDPGAEAFVFTFG